MPKLESDFKKGFFNWLRTEFYGCMILTGNSATQQGIPDTVVLYKDKWVALEFKRSATSSRRPNQPYFVEKLGEMSYAAFVYPENQEEVKNEIRKAFGA